MIYIIDHVLPESYYMNNLRALSVDMAVFRDLLRITFPKLSRHLDVLQNAAQDNTTGMKYLIGIMCWQHYICKASETGMTQNHSVGNDAHNLEVLAML